MPTPYQPGGGSRYGYVEQEMIAPAFKLTFAANARTPRETVENYLLYRAAERSGELGYSQFALKDKLVERLVQESYDPYWGPYGSWGYGHRRSGGSGASVSIGVPLGSSPGYRTVRYSASALVIPFEGSPPPGVAGYHDVVQVLEALGPAVKRPTAVQP